MPSKKKLNALENPLEIMLGFRESLNPANTPKATGRRFMDIPVRETIRIKVVKGNLGICIDTIAAPMGSPSPLYAGASAKCLPAFSQGRFRAEDLKTAHIPPCLKKSLGAWGNWKENLKKHGPGRPGPQRL